MSSNAPNGLRICGIHIRQNRNRPRAFIARRLSRVIYATTIKALSTALTSTGVSCQNAHDAIIVAKQTEQGCPKMWLRMPRTNRRYAKRSMTRWAGIFSSPVVGSQVKEQVAPHEWALKAFEKRQDASVAKIDRR